MMGARIIPAIKSGAAGAILIFAILALFGVIFEANKPMSLGGFFRLAMVWVCIVIPVIFVIIGALSIKMSKRSMRSVKDGCIVSFASGLLAIIMVLIVAVIFSLLSSGFNMSDAVSGLLSPFLIIIILFFSLISMAGGLIYFKFRVPKGS